MLSAIARMNSSTNQRKLYWYMGSMEARSVTEKYSRLEWCATGLYSVTSGSRQASRTYAGSMLCVVHTTNVGGTHCSQNHQERHLKLKLHWW